MGTNENTNENANENTNEITNENDINELTKLQTRYNKCNFTLIIYIRF